MSENADVTFSGDDAGLAAAADKVVSSISGIDSAAKKAGGSVDRLSSSGRDGSQSLDGIANSADSAARSAGQIANIQLGVVGVKSLEFAWKVAAEALSIYRAELAGIEKVSAVVRATGEAAGFSAERLNTLAESVATFSSDFNANDVREGAAALATFNEIRGDQFSEALKLATDLSAVYGGSLTSSAKKLGKALQDPERGMKALEAQGINLSESNKGLIKDFISVGDTVSAQNVLLGELTERVGGAGTATEGLALRQKQVAEFFRASWAAAGKYVDKGLLYAVEATQDFISVLLSLKDNATAVISTVFIGGLTQIAKWGSGLAGLIGGAVGASMEILTNFKDNVVDLMSAIGSALTGQGFNFDYTPLTQGLGEAFDSASEKTRAMFEPGIKALEVNLAKNAQKFSESFARSQKAIQDNTGVGLKAGEAPEITADRETGSFQRQLKVSLNRFSKRFEKSAEAFSEARPDKAAAETVGNAVNSVFSFLEKNDRRPDFSEKPGPSANIVGLTELFDKIQGSAGKSDETKDLARETAWNTKQTARANKAVQMSAKTIAENTGALVAGFGKLKLGFGR